MHQYTHTPTTNNMKLKILPIAAVAAITLASSASAVTVIYSDDFNDQQNISRGGSYTQSLGGSAPSVRNAVLGGSASATWTFDAESGGWGQRDFNDSNVATPTSSNYLAFSPVVGYDYTVTATIDTSNWNGGGVGSWFTVAFTQTPGNWTGTGNILVNLSEANLVRGGEASTTVSFTASGADLIANNIGYVGWITDNAGNQNLNPFAPQVKIDNFSLTAVPEPSAALLGGLGFLALLRRRR